MIRFRYLAVLVPLAAALDPGHAGAQRTATIPPLFPSYAPVAPDTSADTLGLRFRLSPGRGAGEPHRAAPAAGRPLTAAEVERLLARLAPLPTGASPADSFAFPALTLPAPRTGRTVLAAFPPPGDAVPGRPVSAAPAPLQVVRRAPEGPVELGAEVTATFSQPMVPLTSVGALAQREVPLRLTPQPPGRWRWIDVRTLKFEPAGRLPMATAFTVEVPAGTRSAAGRALAEPVRWSFATPAPVGVGAWPYYQPAPLEPVMVVVFDQAIDRAAVLRTVRVRAGGVVIPVRLATRAEVAGDAEARTRVAGHDSTGWVAFRAVRPLPGDAAIEVTVGPGTPSAEGPLRTEAAQQWGFRTYGRFRALQLRCGWGGVCRPGMPWAVELNQGVDETAFREEMVRVEPALPGMQVQLYGQMLLISGRSAPMTRYTVRLAPELRDRFGQTLGPSEPLVVAVGAPLGELMGPPERLVVLDPLARREVSVFSHDHRRLRLRIHRVRPEEWPAFAGVERPEQGGAALLPGSRVVDRTLTVDAPAGEFRETRIDVTPALADGLGHAIVAVEALDGESREVRRQAVYLWVQSTRIGIAAFSDREELVAWATSLVDGEPVGGAELEIRPYGVSGRTGADGLGTLRLPVRGDSSAPAFLVARAGADAALLPEAGRGGRARWAQAAPGARALWYAFTDRNLYRPGERVRFKGWVRRLEASETARPELPGALGDSVAYRVLDPRRNEIASGTVRLSPLGGFDAEFSVAEGSNLGTGSIELRLARAAAEDYQHSLPFRVDEFRRPEYTVTATAPGGPHLVGGSAEVNALAAYYAGGALPGAPVRWDVTATPGDYTPPGWSEWHFGASSAWWDGARDEEQTLTLEGRTDRAGAHSLRIDFEDALPPRPHVVTAAATVTDVNRQSWTAQAPLLVHPAELYVGMRTERAWLERGDSLLLDLAVVDLDGKPVAGRPVTVRSQRSVWKLTGGRWLRTPADSARCDVVSAPEPVTCVFRTDEGGLYEVAGTTTDARGRPTRTSLHRWVWAPGVQMPRPGMNQEGRLELVPDRDGYAAGDTARVLVRLPFHPVRGVVTLRRNGIVRAEELHPDGPIAVLRVPIGEDDVPNVHVQVDAVGATARGEGARGVDFASGSVSLGVPPATRVLTVSPAPRDSVAEPDGDAEVEVEVKGADGRVVPGAEVALVVVDEAVLALSDYTIADPLDWFYPLRAAGTTDVHLRPLVLVEAPDFEPAPETLVGRVVDTRTGQPIGNAAVMVVGDAPLRVQTDAHGRFRITGVPRGRLTLTISRPDYIPARRTVEVGEQAPAPIRVSLLPSPAQTLLRERLQGRAAGVDVESRSQMMADAQPVALEGLVATEVTGALIAVRTNFDPLAVFSPVVRTGADGRARVPFRLPSNLTRYRVIAVAVEGGDRYGVGESTLTARRALMVRPSAPRFLNFGDRFELPVVIQNQTGAALEVDVAARAVGVTMTEGGERVVVPAHDRVEVRLAAEATRAGPAFFQVAAASGERSDAAQLSLPVWTPATAEAFATYGSLTGDSAEVLALEVPDAIPAFGGLEVTTSSTALAELTDALLYLVRYPFECTEQVASRLMAVTALRDVLSAFRTEELPKPEELRTFVDADVRRLASLQNPDGGWGFWRKGDLTWPYASIHAAHALQRAREKGYAVPEDTWRDALDYLRQVPRNLPGWYPQDVRRALHAYALYTRDRMGDRVEGEVRQFLAQEPLERQPLQARRWWASLPLETAGFLLSAAAGKEGLRAEADSLARYISNRATETASTATFATQYSEGEYLLLHSERRTDAVVLEALMAADRENPLVVKTVRGLLGHRRAGRWNDTQENAWVLLALDRYFRSYEAETPEFVARVWLGERYAGGHEFRGRSADRALVSVPMRVLQEQAPVSLTVGKEGPGRLYYRAGLRYAPRDLEVTPLQAGFAVERSYEAVDDPGDVALGADGRWRIRAGARVRVTLTMTAPSRRLHVALVDPLPAGFEPVNPELQGSQPTEPSPVVRGRGVVTDEGRSRTWRPWWFEHQNLRDNRAEAFTSLLPAGVYTYSYVARATTPGLFIVPPPRAEEMYSPETFGRGKTERVIVEAREASSPGGG